MLINLNKYNLARIAVVSPEVKIGDVRFNIDKIKEAIETGLQNKCNFYLFPELSVTGYSCGDLFFQDNLHRAVHQALEELQKFTQQQAVTMIVGAPFRLLGKMFNCAVFISHGEICGVVPKTFIPNYDEYYEERWFSGDADRNTNIIIINGKEVPFGTDLIFAAEDFPLMRIGVEICEDLWSVVPPSSDMALAGANLLLNLSASSEYLGKSEYRRNLVVSQSARCHAAYLYSSAGAGESSTDFIMSGHCIIAENGRVLEESRRFSFNTQIIIADIDVEKLNSERLKNSSFAIGRNRKQYREISFEFGSVSTDKLLRYIPKMPFVPRSYQEKRDVCEEILNIQITALTKRLKHIGTNKVVLGVSGGLDSTLALIVCTQTFDRLGFNKKGIIAVSMPCFGTTKLTKINAQKLSEALGVSFRQIDITETVRSHFRDISHDEKNYNIVFENAQARVRTLVLMDIANEVGGIVVGTGDLSEIALGWSTYNGDHMSMYNVNSGVPKTLVMYLIDWAKDNMFEGEVAQILGSIMKTPISPELLPSDEDKLVQQTEQIIGPYLLHDFFLYYFARFGYSPTKIMMMAKVAFGNKFKNEEIKESMKIFITRFFANQYKRSCMPDGVKVGTVALSPRGDWRMPSDAIYNIWISEIERFEL
jgi:NAD+ synthase (glutamine-hydrolysing)